MAKSKARYLADILQSDGSSIFVGDFSVPASFTIDPEGSPGGTVTIAGDIVSTGPAGLDNASLQNDSITLNSYEIALGNSLTLDTDDISESSPSANLWFTQARARESISLTDNGGDGSLSYNSATGEFSFTGPSAAEVRAHFSSGTGVTLSSGQISIGQPVATTDAVTFSNVTTTTTSNIFYDNSISGMTATNVQSAISELNNLVGGGNVGSQASFDSYEFTATSNQTTFDLANLGISPTPGYIVGYIQVFLNGVLLAEADYNATDGQSVVLGSGAETGDILTLVVLDSFDIANTLRVTSFDASAPQNNLVIDANGNVGIGVSPNSLWRSTETVLQMPDAAFYAGNNYVAIGQNYYIPQTGGAIYEESNFASDYYQLGGNHVFRTTSSGTSGNTITWTEAMRIDSSSRVLIGQSSNTGGANADNLIVGTGSGNNGITILSGTTNGGTLAFADADADEDGFISYNHPSQFMQFGIAGAEVARIDSSGNVGIGTSNPLVRFHARNSADGDVFYYWDNFQQAAASSLNETVTHRFYFGNVAGTDVKPAGYIQAGKDSDYSSDSNVDSFLAFGTASNDANAERMRIDSSGRVGIGTLNPDAPLDVHVIEDTYTNYRTQIRLGHTKTNGVDEGSSLSLTGSGQGLGAAIYSNGRYDNDVLVQEVPTRPSGFISFGNGLPNTGTGIIQFGGLVAGTTTPVVNMRMESNGALNLLGAGLQVDGQTIIDTNGAIKSVGAETQLAKTYILPNTSTVPKWIRLGTFTTAQGGQSIHFKFVTRSGYNAINAQAQTSELRFGTSNAGSAQTGLDSSQVQQTSTFFGDAQYYLYKDGNSENTPDDIVIIQKSNSSYEFWGFFGAYTGTGSFFVVSHNTSDAFTYSGTIQTAFPTIGASEYYVQKSVIGIQNNLIVANYDTGTYTATFGGLANMTGTAALNEARYTRVGRNLTIEGRITGLSVTSGGVEAVVVMILPTSGFYMDSNNSRATGSAWDSFRRAIGIVTNNSSGNNTELAIVFPSYATSPGTTEIIFSITYFS